MSVDGGPVLELRNVSTHYGLIAVLREVSIELRPGEIVCLLGGNASGKSTTLKTILGMVTPSQGEVVYRGESIGGLSTTEIVGRGVTMVPENRRLFTRMTVRENLELGSYLRTDKAKVKEDLDRVMELFPRIRERLTQKAVVFGVFVLPSQPLELPYARRLTRTHVIGADMLLDPQARTSAALGVLRGA